MSIYRKKYRDRNGEEKWSRTWSIRFLDHGGVVREVQSETDRKTLAREMLRRIGSLVQHKRAGVPPPREALDWLGVAPFNMRERLMQWGVVPKSTSTSLNPHSTMLEAFEAYMIEKGDGEAHASRTRDRAKKVLEEAGSMHFESADPDRVQAAIRKVADSAPTQKHYWVATKAYFKWGCRKLGMIQHQVLTLQPRFIDTRPDSAKRARRPLEASEFDRLLEQARKSEPILGLSGEAWAMVYELARDTGLRRNEIRTMIPSLCRLDKAPYCIVIPAAYSKRRRQDTVTIGADLAGRIAKYIRERGIGEDQSVFDLPSRTAEVVSIHLERAGIPKRNARGKVFDFHGLRHTFTTTVANNSSPQVAQKAARHQSITTTMLYVHAGDDEVEKAIARSRHATKIVDLSVAQSVASGSKKRAAKKKVTKKKP